MGIEVQRRTHAQTLAFRLSESLLRCFLEEAKGGEHGRQTYDLEERLLDYSAKVIQLVESLPATRSGNPVAGQLLRSGTSALPNHGEAQAAESRRDFIHKLRLCQKELRESKRWLRLLQRLSIIEPTEINPVLNETEQLIRIFAKSIQTARAKREL